jgi:hypothetical protein
MSENREVWIQIRATPDEKARFKEKGGSAGFRKWLNGPDTPIDPAVTAAIERPSGFIDEIAVVQDERGGLIVVNEGNFATLVQGAHGKEILIGGYRLFEISKHRKSVQ